MRRINEIPLFRDISDQLVERYSNHVRWKHFDQNELIIDFDENSTDVGFVLSGRVRVLYRVLNGREVILDELGPGQFFGEMAAIDGNGRSANVMAVYSSEACMVPAAVFRELIDKEPIICSMVLESLVSRIRELNVRLSEHSFLTAKQRLYSELLRQSTPRSGHPGQFVISPPPRHQDVANRIASRREVVSRELSALAKNGVIEKTRGALVLCEPHELHARLSLAQAD